MDQDEASRVRALGEIAAEFDLDAIRVRSGETEIEIVRREPAAHAAPVVYADLLVYSLAQDGLFIANRRTGETLEFFDPGEGVSAQPTITGDGRLYVMSNHGILYAFDLD